MNLVQMSRSLRVYLSILPGTNALGAHYSSEPQGVCSQGDAPLASAPRLPGKNKEPRRSGARILEQESR
jgi:hypothetical protein